MKTKIQNYEFACVDNAKRDEYVQQIVARVVAEFNKNTNNAFADCIEVKRHDYAIQSDQHDEFTSRQVGWRSNGCAGQTYGGSSQRALKADVSKFTSEYVKNSYCNDNIQSCSGVYDGYRITVSVDLNKHSSVQTIISKRIEAAIKHNHVLSHDGSQVQSYAKDMGAYGADGMTADDYAAKRIKALDYSSDWSLGSVLNRVEYTEGYNRHYINDAESVLFYVDVTEFRTFQFVKTDRVFTGNDNVHCGERIWVRGGVGEASQHNIDLYVYGKKNGVSHNRRGTERLEVKTVYHSSTAKHSGSSEFDTKRACKLVKERFERCVRTIQEIKDAESKDYDALTASAIEATKQRREAKAVHKAKSEAVRKSLSEASRNIGDRQCQVKASVDYSNQNVRFEISDMDVAKEVAEYLASKYAVFCTYDHHSR